MDKKVPKKDLDQYKLYIIYIHTYTHMHTYTHLHYIYDEKNYVP